MAGRYQHCTPKSPIIQVQGNMDVSPRRQPLSVWLSLAPTGNPAQAPSLQSYLHFQPPNERRASTSLLYLMTMQIDYSYICQGRHKWLVTAERFQSSSCDLLFCCLLQHRRTSWIQLCAVSSPTASVSNSTISAHLSDHSIFSLGVACFARRHV